MSRCFLFLLSTLIVCMSVGCCGLPCGVTSCNDCDGLSYGRQVVPQRPFDRIRNGSLFCGSGCGEVYVDEWLSGPPECCDPCSGADWVGGVSSCGCSVCRAACWQPGDLLRRFGTGLLGGRNCTGAQSSVDCGCGSCGGGGGCGLLSRGCMLGGRNCGAAAISDCGCSDGSCGGSTIGYSSSDHLISTPATSSSCGCSSASVTPVGSSTIQSAGRLAPPKRDRLTTNY